MIDIWEFNSLDCLLGLPYLRAWHERYEEAGLVIIGVHTPEFAFSREVAHVKSAVGRLGIRYPVVLDSDRALWTAYAATRYPTRHLIDTRGYIRRVTQGEGGYSDIEASIQLLLRERDPHVALPKVMPPIRPEDAPGAVCLPTTPELRVRALATRQTQRPATSLTLPDDRPEGRIYAEGDWKAIPDGIVLQVGSGSIVVPYRASSVNAVLAPAFDPSRSAEPPLSLEILEDGVPLPVERFGEDVRLEDGRARLTIESPRAYALVRSPDAGPHELRLEVPRPGLQLYAFRFGTCLQPKTELTSVRME